MAQHDLSVLASSNPCEGAPGLEGPSSLLRRHSSLWSLNQPLNYSSTLATLRNWKNLWFYQWQISVTFFGSEWHGKCLHGWDDLLTLQWRGVTKPQFCYNFSIRDNFDFWKVLVSSAESYSYLAGVTAAKLWWRLSDMNVLFNSDLTLLKNWEINRMEEIGSVTSTPGANHTACNDNAFMTLSHLLTPQSKMVCGEGNFQEHFLPEFQGKLTWI